MCLGHGQARPPDEIPQGGGSMPGEVPPGQFSQSFVTFKRPARRYPLVQQGIGELLPAPGPAADQAVQFRVHEEMSHALSVLSSHTGRLQDGGEFGPH